jgi:hypothetical protein
MFGLPAATHAYHAGTERGVIGFGSMLGVTMGGIIGGGMLGFAIGSLGCDENFESDCEWDGFTYMIGGAVAGGVLGYVGHAIYDVAANSSVPAPGTDAAASHAMPIQLWFYPSMAQRQEGGARGPVLDGLQVGLALSL